MTSPESLKPIPARMVNYFPNILVAGVMLLAGNVMATILALAVQQATARATGQPRPALARIAKLVVLTGVGILAAAQLGINTMIINITVAAFMFGLAATVAMLIGLGGRDVARHVSAGRVLRRLVNTGDTIEVEDIAGVVVAIHPATVEVVLPSGVHVHLAHARLLAAPFRTSRDRA
jgi:hypothetical protein